MSALRSWLKPIAIGVAIGLAGCASLPRSSSNPSPPKTPIAESSTVEQSHYRAAGQSPDADNRPNVITLPQAIHEALYTSLRVNAREEKIHQAMADLKTQSLIPNSQLFWDYQFIPLQHTDIFNQAGPPQTDLMWTVPIDWLLFGKRVAAIEASRLGVDVATFDMRDFVRKHVQETVDAFYEHLLAKELFRLATEDLKELEKIEEIVKKQVGAGGAGAIEVDRARLARLDAKQEVRRRETEVAVTKAKLRPLIGRSAAGSDFEITGTLEVTQAAKPPDLATVLALADQSRPDLLSDLKSIDQARASVASERRKGKPQISIQNGLSGQIQRRVTGFPNAISYDVGVTTSLPITDRNQGNVLKAMSQLRESSLTFEADRADAAADVEKSLQQYREAYEHVTQEDLEFLKSAKSMRDRIEAAYQAGGRRFLEVLDAQRAYRDRVRTVVSNRADYWRALNSLNAAVGTQVVGAEALPAPAKP